MLSDRIQKVASIITKREDLPHANMVGTIIPRAAVGHTNPGTFRFSPKLVLLRTMKVGRAVFDVIFMGVIRSAL